MIITKIEQQKKNTERFSVYLDESFGFGISQEVLLSTGLYKGMTLTPEQVQTVKEQEYRYSVYSRALNYLSFRIRSVQEMEDYLAKLSLNHPGDETEEAAHPSEELVATTIQRLLDQGYLNDLYFSESFIRTQANVARKGPRWIANALSKKGVDPITIEEAMIVYPEEQIIENMVHLAEKYVQKQQKRYPHRMIRQKLIQYLLTNGYDMEMMEEHFLSGWQSEPHGEEDTLLNKEATKQLRRIRQKYKGYDLKQRLVANLSRKGFSFDQINEWLEERENQGAFEE